jgi:hypothetical protein
VPPSVTSTMSPLPSMGLHHKHRLEEREDIVRWVGSTHQATPPRGRDRPWLDFPIRKFIHGLQNRPPMFKPKWFEMGCDCTLLKFWATSINMIHRLFHRKVDLGPENIYSKCWILVHLYPEYLLVLHGIWTTNYLILHFNCT